MTTKVFVSHSAKSEEHQKLLNDFVKLLSDHDFIPWVDYDGIDVGDPWNEKINVGLHECQAAVILFSEKALQSDFVKYEVSCSIYRKHTQPGFGLFPVIIDDTPVETVTRDFFGAIQLGDYQIGKLEEKQSVILEKLQAIDPSITTPNSAIEGDLFRIFRQISPEVLREATLALDWETWENVGLPDGEALHFVRRLLAESLGNQIRALIKIKNALPLPVKIEDVFNKVAPFWVDEDAALLLDSVRYESPGKRCAILNAMEPVFTCEQFLKRARPIEDSGIQELQSSGGVNNGGVTEMHTDPVQFSGSRIVGGRTSSGRRSGQDLVVQIRRALCHYLNVNPSKTPNETDIEINKELQFEETISHPLVDVLKLEKYQLRVLVDLADRYELLTLIVLTGREIPILPAELTGRIKVIEPLLQHDDSINRHNEEYAYKWWCRRNRLLGIVPGE